MVPLSPEGMKCKVVANLREDYIGRDLPKPNDRGQAGMSVTREREDGQDLWVLAPTAVIRL